MSLVVPLWGAQGCVGTCRDLWVRGDVQGHLGMALCGWSGPQGPGDAKALVRLSGANESLLVSQLHWDKLSPSPTSS